MKGFLKDRLGGNQLQIHPSPETQATKGTVVAGHKWCRHVGIPTTMTKHPKNARKKQPCMHYPQTCQHQLILSTPASRGWDVNQPAGSYHHVMQIISPHQHFVYFSLARGAGYPLWKQWAPHSFFCHWAMAQNKYQGYHQYWWCSAGNNVDYPIIKHLVLDGLYMCMASIYQKVGDGSFLGIHLHRFGHQPLWAIAVHIEIHMQLQCIPMGINRI